MSFKTQTIIVLTTLGLVPYVITMLILGRAYRSDYEGRIRADMEYKLTITADRLDQALRTLDNDLRFMASLDIMNDVLTDDLDRRIFKLLSMKKEDLNMAGDFDVVSTGSVIVASSDAARIGGKAGKAPFLSVPLTSTFDHSPLGTLAAHYDESNLTRLFVDDAHLRYALVDVGAGDASLADAATRDKVLRARQRLKNRPALAVELRQERAFAMAVIDRVTSGFYFALGIGALLIAGVAYFSASRILSPILMLSATARSIAETEDYSKRVNIERVDEIGQLATAFNQMIGSIQKMLGRLSAESENRLRLAQEKERAEMLQNLSNKLSKYLSPQVFNSIFSGKRDVTLTSSRKKLTIFFSDIVNFTSTTDQMESEDLTLLLNSYLREMTDIALRYGATVDKYVGDAIMIFFGDPETLGVAQDARQCVEMAIAMQTRARELQEAWRAEGIARPFSIRVGIHTGYCTVGNFGTESRMDYTIIGSAVNQASRIESSAEPGSIYLSEDTWLLVREHFACFPVAEVKLKGLSSPVKLYRVRLKDAEDAVLSLSEAGFELSVQPDKLTETSRKRLAEALQTFSHKKEGASTGQAEEA